MKITPLEIRQKEFEKRLRGYDKEEVSAFLQSLSNEWERVLDENKEWKIKLDQAEKEVEKLREVESSLFKTLKTAEDTGANLVDQANKAAELHLKETQMKAEAMMTESKQKAQAIIERAEEEAKEIINEVQEGVKELEKDYKSIENQRDNLIEDLMNLANDILTRIERTSKEKSDFNLQDQIKRVRDLARESGKKIDEEHLEIETKPLEPISVDKIQKEMADKKAQEVNEMGKPKSQVKSKEAKKALLAKAKKAAQQKKQSQQNQEKESKKNTGKDADSGKDASKSQESFFDLLDDDDQ